MILTETLVCEFCFIDEKIEAQEDCYFIKASQVINDRDRNQSGFIFLNYTSLTFLNNILQSTVILEKKYIEITSRRIKVENKGLVRRLFCS